ncbi:MULTISPECIES: GntR family transcriptional regulator [Novosphingobium]|uniref:GntR family transcriptional regulator n=1 Tax=Novosphingobium sp. TCA1 TaxID=2682474 RepID=UPI000A376EA9|nr:MULTISPECIES: GntR family transcriptional regulator [Novosphingobium]GFE74948.1 GntR family transcriptional regulator [Novosphingobium sp. TCA1]
MLTDATQTVRGRPSALTRLREMILRGMLQPGERLLEVELAERLDMSRTPIRQALPALALEGLVVPAGGRGYAVRAFTRAESLDALHLRAMLEGYAARSIVLAGKGRDVADRLAVLLAEGDALLSAAALSDTLEEKYGVLNERFHDVVVEGAGNSLLKDLIGRCNVVPFTSPKVIAFEETEEEEILELMRFAHRQHHAIVNAFRAGDALRVEMLFREHATTQESSMAMGETLRRAL